MLPRSQKTWSRDVTAVHNNFVLQQHLAISKKNKLLFLFLQLSTE